jgi:hypothetical protein
VLFASLGAFEEFLAWVVLVALVVLAVAGITSFLAGL